MHCRQMSKTGRPTLVRQEPSDPRRDELVIPRCTNCDNLLPPLTAACTSCGGCDLENVASSGTGSVVSSRVVQRPPNGLSGEAVSYTIAIVALDEGPWVYTSLEGDVPTVSDEPIRVQFRPSTPGERFPVFGVCAA